MKVGDTKRERKCEQERKKERVVIRETVWLDLKGCVGLGLSTEPVLKVAQHHYLSHLHPNDGTGSKIHTHTHTLTHTMDSPLCSKQKCVHS